MTMVKISAPEHVIPTSFMKIFALKWYFHHEAQLSTTMLGVMYNFNIIYYITNK